MKKLPLLLAAAALIAAPLVAEDAEGCKDSTLLSRMPSCSITTCDRKDFDAGEFKTAYKADDNDFVVKSVEGQKEEITYECATSVSPLSIARNAENALKKAGFTTLYSGKNDNEQPMITARKGGTWVQVLTFFNGDAPSYTQLIVHSKEMEQSMEVSAAAMEEQINSTGRVALYGIQFETGKAAITPASSATLEEVAKLLQKNAAWKIEIGGHTDNVGAADANAKLSAARAEAVRSWLAGHGIAAARLTTKGYGDSVPVGDNRTEEGRAKNRRVELMKM